MKTYLPEMTYIEVIEARDRGAGALVPIGTIEGNAPPCRWATTTCSPRRSPSVSPNANGAIRLPGDRLWGVGAAVGLSRTVSRPARGAAGPGREHLPLADQARPRAHPRDQQPHPQPVPDRDGVPAHPHRDRRDRRLVYAAMLARDLGADIFDNPKAIGHGAEPGTSLMMHIVPHGMRMDLVEEARKTTEFAGLDPRLPLAVAHENSQVNVYLDLHELTPNGAMANPDGVSAEKGAAVMERIVDFVAPFVDLVSRRRRPHGQPRRRLLRELRSDDDVLSTRPPGGDARGARGLAPSEWPRPRRRARSCATSSTSCARPSWPSCRRTSSRRRRCDGSRARALPTGMTDVELADLGIAELLGVYACKEASPSEAIDAHLARIDRLDPQVGAVLTFCWERAGELAAESTQRWVEGRPRPLEGVPYGLKDIIETADPDDRRVA